jgi:hypothetical protein
MVDKFEIIENPVLVNPEVDSKRLSVILLSMSPCEILMYKYGIAPITLKSTKTRTIRAHDCLYVSSFRSHNAFNRNPEARNTIAVANNATAATMSLSINERMIGRMIKSPEIWSTKPKFDRSALNLI